MYKGADTLGTRILSSPSSGSKSLKNYRPLLSAGVGGNDDSEILNRPEILCIAEHDH